MNRAFNFTGLNPEQREAVEYISGPTLVFAGAGSGKTRVLTYKIAYLVSRGVKPWRILAVTFTNKAAREMAGRVEHLLNMPGGNLWLGTFHSMCVRILRYEADRWGFPRDFTIYDRDDQIAVVKKTLKETGLRAEEPYTPSRVISVIGKAKNDGISPETFRDYFSGHNSQVLEDLYRRYNEQMRRAGAFDFDDLLLKPVDMFEKDPESLEKWRNRFSYILVDEYQDTNRVQYRLIKLLSGNSGNVTVVGDDDQSIYGWRGADIRNILEFEGEFSGVKTIRLEQNYRSTGFILKAANAVVSNNKNRMSKNLWTEFPDGEKVRVMECRNDREEADRIVTGIEHEREDKFSRLRDFVILYRTNAQSRLFEDMFRRRGIPYVIVGGTKFYERKEIRDILAYLRFAANFDDSVSFERAISVPKHGIGAKTIETIEQFAAQNRITLMDALARADEFLSRNMVNRVKKFYEIPRAIADMRGKTALNEIGREVYERTGYELYLRKGFSANAEDRIDNVKELITAMGDFINETDEDDLSSFLAEVSLVTDVDIWDDNSDAVTLMTLHSAKGLEFPSVYLAGVENKLFPLSRSLESNEEFEEERRLFYVGITRAKELLHVSYACQRLRYGSISGGASMFINELPPEVIEFEAAEPVHRGSFRRMGKYKMRAAAFEDYSQEIPDYEKNSFFSVGAFIRHPKFGRGKITGISGTGDELKLTVLFGATEKKIMPKYTILTPA